MSSRIGIAGIVLLAAFGLAACGGGGGTTASTDGDDDTAMEQTPQQMCEAANGRWNDDGTCTSATDLAAEIADATKAALTKKTAIATEAMQALADDAGLGGSAATATGNAEGAYNLAISRDRSGTTVTVTVEGATDADDEDFVGDQPGQMLTRTMEATETTDAMTEVAVVHTDIEAPVATPFGDVHTLDAREDGETATEDLPNDAFQIAAASLGMVKASAFTAPAGTPDTVALPFQHAVADDPSTEDVDESREAARIPGTFNGAAGTYVCAASATCTVTVNTMGVVSRVSADNDWIFVPASGATVDVADTEYLHYGFWLKKTTTDGAVTYNEVETFAGSTEAASGSTADVEGTAKYEGGAAGVYVHKTFAEDGTSEATSGHFTATANLEMNFGGDDIPVNQQDRLTGRISGFMLSGGEDNDWTVTLQSDGDPNTEGIQPDIDGALAGTAKGNVEGEDGSFSATFHGSVAAVDHDNDANTPNIVPQPHTIVGEFNSTFTNGSVAGGFGARKAE